MRKVEQYTHSLPLSGSGVKSQICLLWWLWKAYYQIWEWVRSLTHSSRWGASDQVALRGNKCLSECVPLWCCHTECLRAQGENSRGEDRVNFCCCGELNDGKVFCEGHCVSLLFRLSGMKANQITLKPFSPNPHHIISQHKPCWISGYWTSNQLSLAPL